MRKPHKVVAVDAGCRRNGRRHSRLRYMVLTASQFLQTATVIMGIVIIAAIAYAFDMLMRWLERRLVPRKGRM